MFILNTIRTFITKVATGRPRSDNPVATLRKLVPFYTSNLYQTQSSPYQAISPASRDLSIVTVNRSWSCMSSVDLVSRLRL
jgi:hypothetical protein